MDNATVRVIGLILLIPFLIGFLLPRLITNSFFLMVAMFSMLIGLFLIINPSMENRDGMPERSHASSGGSSSREERASDSRQVEFNMMASTRDPGSANYQGPRPPGF